MVPPQKARTSSARTKRPASPPGSPSRGRVARPAPPQPPPSSERTAGRKRTEQEQLLLRASELEAKVAELDALLVRSERTVKALRDVGLALGSTLDLDQLLELILRK